MHTSVHQPPVHLVPLIRAPALALAGFALLAGCGDDSSAPSSDASGSTAGATGGTTDASTSLGETTTTATGTTAPSSDASDSSSGSDSSSTGSPAVCWTDLGYGEVEIFYSGFDDGSEGIAFGVDGDLYVTTSTGGVGVVWRLDAAANATAFADVPFAIGLAPVATGDLIVASLGIISEPDGAVYTVAPDGTTSLLAEGIDSPNFVAIAADGSALISDDFDTRVFRVDLDGSVRVVIENVASPNGIAYSPSGRALYVASTFSSFGELTRFDVDDEGMPIESTGTQIMRLGPGSTPDGIAVDENNFVYVAANLKGEVWRVDGASGGLADGELVAEGLESPASLAFGQGDAFDPCSLYITELFGNAVVRLGVGAGGARLYQ